MKTIEIICNNWTGDVVEVVTDGTSFQFFQGDKFNLEPSDLSDDYMTILHIKNEEGDKVGSLAQFRKDGVWTATDTGFSINRDDFDPIVAAAQLLCAIS